MKTTHKLLGSVAVAAILFTGCGGGGGGNAEGSQSSSTQIEQSERATQVTMDFQLTSLFEGSNIGKRELRAATLSQGEMTIINVDSGASKTETFNLFIDESDFSVSTSKTLLLDPGTYSSTMIVERDGTQYYGEVQFEVNDGQQTIPQMSITPIIGDLVTNVNVASELYTMNLAYEVNELTAFTNPKIGVIVDGGEELLFTINKATGLSETRWNMATGEHQVSLNFYDGSLQVGKSKLSSYTVDFSRGEIGNLDIVPLTGKSTFNFDVDSASLNMEFSVPSVIVEETGGVDNLKALLTIVSDSNSSEYELNLTENNNTYAGAIVALGVSFGELTYSLEFFDINDDEKIGSCNLSTVLNSSSQSTVCDIDLVRRGVAGGSLLNNIGFTVYDTEGNKVSGAEIYSEDTLIGLTDLNGFLQTNLSKGTHSITAKFNGINGNVNISESSVLGNLNYDVYLENTVMQPQASLEWTYQFNDSDSYYHKLIDHHDTGVLIQDGGSIIKMQDPNNILHQNEYSFPWTITSKMLNNGNVVVQDAQGANITIFDDNQVKLKSYDYNSSHAVARMVISENMDEIFFSTYELSEDKLSYVGFSSDGTEKYNSAFVGNSYTFGKHYDVELKKIFATGSVWTPDTGTISTIYVTDLENEATSKIDINSSYVTTKYSDKKNVLYYTFYNNGVETLVAHDVFTGSEKWRVTPENFSSYRSILTQNEEYLIFDGNFSDYSQKRLVSLNVETLESCEYQYITNTPFIYQVDNGVLVRTSSGNSSKGFSFNYSYLNPQDCSSVVLESELNTSEYQSSISVITDSNSSIRKESFYINNRIFLSEKLSDDSNDFKLKSFDTKGNLLGSEIFTNDSSCKKLVAIRTKNNTIIYIDDNEVKELNDNLEEQWRYEHSESFSCDAELDISYDAKEVYVIEGGKLHKIKF